MVVLLALGAWGAMVQPAEAQASAPWFGAADRSRPSDGWVFRVPVLVDNPYPNTLSEPLVTVPLDFGKLLVQAGWINQTAGSEVRARGFTLDPDSIRVVEYERGWREFKNGAEVAIARTVYPSLLTQTSRGRDFDATTNPVGTVVWRVTGSMATEEKRYFMVYFKALQYGDTPPPDTPAKELAPLEAVGWSGLGTVFYGREQGAAGNANRIDLYVPEQLTTVTFYTYELGQPKLWVPTSTAADAQNPIIYNNATNRGQGVQGVPGGVYRYSLPQNADWKIVASKPILVFHRGALTTAGDGSGAAYGAGPFIPGTDGLYASRSFVFPNYGGGVVAYAAESGRTTVSGAIQGTLSSSQQFLFSQPIGVPNGNVPWLTVTAPNPILLQYYSAAREHRQLAQAPALTGAPTGTTFLFNQEPDDLVHEHALASAATRLLDPAAAANQLDPLGDAVEAGARELRVGAGCTGGHDITASAAWGGSGALALRAEAPPAGGPPGDLAVLAGGLRSAPGGYFGGEGGRRIVAAGPLAIAAFYDETKLTITECTTKTPVESKVSLNADGLYRLEGARTLASGAKSYGIYEINSTKPVSVFATRSTDTYAAPVAGLPITARATVSPLEFRGHLVDLRSAERPGLQVFKSTGPNRPVEFKLTATNLGRWIGGGDLPDAVRITCASDQPWELKGCDRDVRLSSFASETFGVTVTPKDALPNQRGIVTVTASSSGAPNVTASVRLFVTVETTYGVGTWFDVEGGLKFVDPPVSLAPGETHTYRVVVKNLGSVEDSFILERVQAADAQGWSARLVRDVADDEETTRITLAPGESETLRLVVTSPERPVLNFFDATVKATSIASASATDKVSSATRIRADIQFAMSVDERTKLASPGLPAEFKLSLLNRGNDIVRVGLSREGLLPPGWTSRILDPDGNALTEVNLGLGPPFNVTVEVTPPDDARAGDLATIRLAGETAVGEETRRDEESATVVVRQVHNLTLPEPSETVAVPGQVLEFHLDLTNVGNGDEIVELIESTARPAWPLHGPPGGMEILRGESGTFDVTATVPEATPARGYELNFTLRLSREGLRNVTLPVVVKAVRQIAMELPVDVALAPGATFEFPVDVRNTGNVKDVANLAATVPAGWTAAVDPASIFLAPGDSERVTLRLNASLAARDGAHPVEIVATFANGDASRRPVEAEVGRPELRLGDPLATGSPRRGQVIVVTVPVVNLGGMEAKDVRVALLVNGEVVDSVVIGRLLPGAGRGADATLTWTVDRAVRDIQIVLNPGAPASDAPAAEGSVASVTFARGIPSLALAPTLALALALAAATARRRTRGADDAESSSALARRRWSP